MENEETDSISSCETGQDILQRGNGELLPSTETTSNGAYQDEKEDLGPSGSEENSVLTFGSTSVPSQTIKVYLRLKPFPAESDLTKEQEDAYTIVNATTLLAKFPGLDVSTRSLKNLKASERVCRTFTFTTAFGPDVSQTELFDGAIESQIRNFLAGQNSTVMSYGTSNAGKSYTLYGDPSALGIIPLSMKFIFSEVKSTLSTPWYKPICHGDVIGLSSNDRVRELEVRDKLLSFTSPEKTEFINAYRAMGETMREEEAEGLTSRQDVQVIYSVWISFAEIYNDAIYDLLSSDWQKKRLPLKMVTDKHGRTFIKDLRTVYVNSGEEAYQILLAGQYRSRVAATTLNARSSRSHCIFTMKLLKYYAESSPEDVEVSSLSFCDLAGSGRLKMTTNVRDRLKETQNINTSLLVLGRCLKSIWEGQSVRQKSEVIGPFRESKLTRLFQKALCGKEQITLIVNVNPVPSLYAETQNVLNFSAIAKKIIVEPAKEVKRKMFTSRFSRVVSQSVKTVTDWDHVAVEESTHEMYPGMVNTSDYIHRECYDELSIEHEKLKKEYAALRASMIDKDLEIREEMANTYTGLINNLEASWRSHSKDAEEQQEHLLNWSVSQVENFYKEKLNRLNSRKRRRWDDGDAVDDREADVREMEAEIASLTAKILVTKETIKELRSGRENAIAEKNKAVFELSLVKEEIIGVKKMLEAAENDIRSDEDGAHFIHELKKQLSSRQERIKNLKEFLNEAKEEYIRITSDAGQMQEELKEANETLIENAERIEDLEEQLDQSNIFLAQRTKEIEQLTEKLEEQGKQLAEFEERAKIAEKELKESEDIRLNLIGAVEDLNKLHKVSCIRDPQDFDHSKSSSTDSENHIDPERDIADFEKQKIASEITNVESENSPVRREFREKNRVADSGSLVTSLEGLKGKSIEIRDTDSVIDPDESIYKENENGFKLSVSSGINDSGIAMTMSSGNQTMEQTNSTVDTDVGAEGRNDQTNSAMTCGLNSADAQFENLQLENDNESGGLTEKKPHDTIWLKKLFHELEDAKRETANFDHRSSDLEVQETSYSNHLQSVETELRSVNVNELQRELQFADQVRIDRYEKELESRMDKEGYCYEVLNDKVSRLEQNLSELSLLVETKAAKYFSEHEIKFDKLAKEISELKDRHLSKSESRPEDMHNTLEKDVHTLSELKQKVTELEIALAKWQKQEGDRYGQSIDSIKFRLSLLEIPIQNWPTRDLEDETGISPLSEKSKNDSDATLAKVEKHICDELWPKVNNQSNEDPREDFKVFHAFQGDTGGKYFGNEVDLSCSRNEEMKKIHILKTENTSWSEEASSNAIDLLTAPTSTPRGGPSSDAKLKLTTSLSKTSISSKSSVVKVEEKSVVTKKRDRIRPRSKPLEISNSSKCQNVRTVTKPTERSEKRNDPVRGNASSALNHPATFFSGKSVAFSLMKSSRTSRNTKPVIQKTEDYVESEPKQELVIRNKKLR